jgi:hypothetical protein
MNLAADKLKVVDYSKEIPIENIPEGIRAFIKEKNIPEGADFTAYLHKLKKGPGEVKARKYFKEKMINQFYEGDFDESYIKEKYGGGAFQVTYTWKNGKGEPHGIQVEPIFIDGPEKEDNQPQKESPKEGQTPAGANPPIPPAGSPFDVEKLLKWIPIITGLITTLKDLIPKPDYSIIEKLQDSQIKTIDRFGQQLAKMQMEALKNNLSKINQDESEAEQMNNFNWPEWLKPFSGLIEGYADKLLGNGPFANALKKTLVKNATFQECWFDEQKKSEAVDALSKYFGPETAEALENTFDGLMNEAA